MVRRADAQRRDRRSRRHPLCQGAREADEEVGKGLEETLAKIKHGRGPLHMAAWAGRLEMCEYLVDELRLNVNAPGDDGATPLSYAIYGCGSTSVVRFLLDRGAKPNKTDVNGITALHFATMTGTQADSQAASLWEANTRDTCEIAELLLSRGAYVDPICEEGTPLIIAAKKGNMRMLELLLRHQANAGADVNAGKTVVTPLMLAASYGFACGIKCLLEAGADASIRDEKFGRTAAEIASNKGWTDCVEILSALTSTAGSDDPLLNANDGCALKEQGDAAFDENDYAVALAVYTKGWERKLDPDYDAMKTLQILHLKEE